MSMIEQGMSLTLPLSPALAERFVVALERLAGTGPAAPALDTDALLSMEDVAARLQKSKREVQRLVTAGKLRKVSGLGKKTVRIRPADLRKFLESPEEKQVGRRRL